MGVWRCQQVLAFSSALPRTDAHARGESHLVHVSAVFVNMRRNILFFFLGLTVFQWAYLVNWFLSKLPLGKFAAGDPTSSPRPVSPYAGQGLIPRRPACPFLGFTILPLRTVSVDDRAAFSSWAIHSTSFCSTAKTSRKFLNR